MVLWFFACDGDPMRVSSHRFDEGQSRLLNSAEPSAIGIIALDLTVIDVVLLGLSLPVALMPWLPPDPRVPGEKQVATAQRGGRERCVFFESPAERAGGRVV